MDSIDNVRIKRWDFSSEALKLCKELNIFTEFKEDELPDPWHLVLSYIVTSTEKIKETDEDEDFLSQSSLSTTVDDEEWEDLELYLKECENRRKANHDDLFSTPLSGASKNEEIISVNCDKLNKIVIDRDKIDNKDKIVGRSNIRAHVNQKYDYNIFSQMCYTQELNELEESEVENDAIVVLKEAVLKEEPNTEEVAELLPQLSKQQLLDLWTELDSSDSGRLCLYSAMVDCKYRTVFLCQKLLLPLLSNSNTEHLNEIVRKIAIVLPKISDIAVKHLIAPLIAKSGTSTTSNPFLKESYLLQDIMSHLGEDHWNCLLSELLTIGMKIESRHFPLMKVVIESCSESIIGEVNTMSKLFSLMKSTMKNYSKDRDFGLLILAVINRAEKLDDVSSVITKSLKDISDSYKGPMRFRISSSVKQLCK